MNKSALIPFIVILGMFIFASCSGKRDREKSTENHVNSKGKEISHSADKKINEEKNAKTRVNSEEKGILKPAVKEIRGDEEFKNIIENSGDRLLVFDLYADWCQPCRMVSPVIERIAEEKGDKASFYKINVDKNPGISRMFGVRSIPYIVFIKNKKAVYSLIGVRSKNEYIQSIEKFASSAGLKK